MSRYVAFTAAAGGNVLVEVDDDAASGIEKAGLRGSAADGAVARAEATFEQAVASAVTRSVAALSEAVSALSHAPAEVELTFGLKATGEIGNVAIAKAGGEANFTVRLLRRPETA